MNACEPQGVERGATWRRVSTQPDFLCLYLGKKIKWGAPASGFVLDSMASEEAWSNTSRQLLTDFCNTLGRLFLY